LKTLRDKKMGQRFSLMERSDMSLSDQEMEFAEDPGKLGWTMGA
jgi:hypothetical protein